MTQPSWPDKKPPKGGFLFFDAPCKAHGDAQTSLISGIRRRAGFLSECFCYKDASSGESTP
jgi:hypothetical protein